MEKLNARKVVELYDKLKSCRSNFENQWYEISKFFIPNKDSIYDFNTKTEESRGEKKLSLPTLYDSTGPQALNLLASALHGMLTNPTVKWFDLYTGISEIDRRDDVRRWLQACVSRMHDVFNNSNFQNEIHENYIDLCGFGTTTIRIEEDDTDVVRFHARPIYEMVIKENYLGIVDTVIREYEISGEDVVKEFGFDPFKAQGFNVSAETYMKKYKVVHGIFPRDSKMFGKIDSKNKPFASVKVLRDFGDCKHYVESGFDEFPICVPRWSKLSGESYGRSPAMIALADVKMLNEMKKTMIRSAQKRVDPPLMAPDDGIIGQIRLTPGGITYYRSGTENPIKPIDMGGAAVDFGYQLISDTQSGVRDIFYITQLQLQEGPQMTATEVLQRTEEQLRVLSPVLGRLHNELLKPLIDRVFGIMLRNGKLPEGMPDILKGREIRVSYSSMIARAQKSSEADNIRRIVDLASPFIQISPEVVDNIDADEAFRYIARMFSAPQEIIRDESDRDDLRSARAQQAQQAQEQQDELAQAEVINKVSPMAKVSTQQAG